MTRLIYANALLEELKGNGTYLLPDGADESEYIYYSEAVDLIKNAPTVEGERDETSLTSRFEVRTDIVELLKQKDDTIQSLLIELEKLDIV